MKDKKNKNKNDKKKSKNNKVSKASEETNIEKTTTTNTLNTEEATFDTMVESPEPEPEKDFLTTEAVEILFKQFDKNRNGYITIDEISMAFSQFQIDVDFDDCQAVLAAFDQNGCGVLQLQDFYREMSDIITKEPTEDHIQIVFNAMDNDRNGFIGPDEIKEQFQLLGVEITQEEAIKAIVAMDKSGYGIVDYETFKEYFESKMKSANL